MLNLDLYFNYSMTTQTFTQADAHSQIPVFTTTDHDIINIKSHCRLPGHINTCLTYIINICLSDLPSQGSPTHLMYLSLLPYFSDPDEGHLHCFNVELGDSMLFRFISAFILHCKTMIFSKPSWLTSHNKLPMVILLPIGARPP